MEGIYTIHMDKNKVITPSQKPGECIPEGPGQSTRPRCQPNKKGSHFSPFPRPGFSGPFPGPACYRLFQPSSGPGIGVLFYLTISQSRCHGPFPDRNSRIEPMVLGTVGLAHINPFSEHGSIVWIKVLSGIEKDTSCGRGCLLDILISCQAGHLFQTS